MHRSRLARVALFTLILSTGVHAAPPVFNAQGLLTDTRGMTLYTYDPDVAGSGKSVCNGPCAAIWPPLKVEGGDRPAGDFSSVKRDDGTPQWAYKGKPLYLWIKDTKPGDTTGTAVEKWQLVKR
jgi:predicted lipoprotein with Yx(FWY)xxD motif